MTTAKKLIQDSFKKAGIFDAAEEVEGIDMEAGKELLNDIITQWSSLGVYIPTFETITVDLESGTSEYTVSPLIIQILEANLTDSANVITQLTVANAAQQNSFNYALSSARPGWVYCEPRYNLIDISTDEASSVLWFYNTPNADYTATLMVKQILTELDYSDTIAQFPRYAQRALKYELTAELADEYGTTLSSNFMQKHQEIIRQLKAANKKDLSVKNTNPFSASRFYRPWGYYGGY
jgi:hypothetical protein